MTGRHWPAAMALARLALACVAANGLACCVTHSAGAQTRASAETIATEETPVVLDRWLVDEHGRRRRFRGDIVGARVTVLSFSYTGCGAICPVSDLVMGELEDTLRRNGRGDVALATLTLDPFTDTPEQLRAHAKRLRAGPLRHFYTGAPADMFAVLDGLGMRYGRLDEHATFFLVFARDGSARRWPVDAGPEELLAATGGGSR
jgi:cytochrome oxidase Cu insertion factor (SCO1/SenC/PrrC family)